MSAVWLPAGSDDQAGGRPVYRWLPAQPWQRLGSRRARSTNIRDR
jgi:hypothetical protein